jgi:hypothetical protein
MSGCNALLQPGIFVLMNWAAAPWSVICNEVLDEIQNTIL